MAKAIKFNLILNKQPVRDLEDLRTHFNIEDLLEAFHNGSLQRWLEVRDLTAELEKVNAVSGDTPVIAVALCSLFQGPCTKEDAEAAAYIFELRQKERQKLLEYQSLAEERNKVIANYHAEYDTLLASMEKKYNDSSFLKASIQEIFQNYRGLFQLNAADFYDRFVFSYPLIILSIMANQDMKKLLTRVRSEDRISQDLNDQERKIASFIQRYEAKDLPQQKTCHTKEDLMALQARADRVLVLDAPDKTDLGLHFTAYLTTPFDYIEMD
ncbi:MAG: hypothetical protein LBD13_03640 [Spirochaetaceae bacterium]|jgi:hypothetical protein|nr:hypothetical protein [Spirochaetaceae bacterium]